MAEGVTEKSLAVFEGSLVNLKNSPTHKSIVLQIEVPEEYGEAIVRAFGWPTRVKPLPVAVARLEAGTDNPGGLVPLDTPFSRQVKEEYGQGTGKPYDWHAEKKEPPAQPRPFESLTPAQQAGIVCKDPEFAEFLRTTVPYKHDVLYLGFTPEELVRDCCGVKSRADILPGTNAELHWRSLYKIFRRWQDERNRTDPGV